MNWIQVLSAIAQAYWFPLLLILSGFVIVTRGLLTPRAFTPHWVLPDQWKRDYVDQYNIAEIRNLLEKAFTADELKEFCHDRPAFRPVLKRVSPDPSSAKLAQALIEHCETRLLFDKLLADIRKVNPTQYEERRHKLYPEGAVPLSWRHIPTLSRLPRYGVMGIGGTLAAIGLVWIMITSVSFAPSATLLSLSYMAGNSNPQTVDLRTASSSGIPVSDGTSLQFFDLWISVPEDAPDCRVKVEIYAGETLVGWTEPILLISDRSHPGTAQLSDIVIERHEHDDVPEAWRVQKDWKKLDIVLITERRNRAVASTSTTIRLAADGTAIYFNPPLLSFASIVYSVNDGPPIVLDLRDAESKGLGLEQDDVLTILEIWYSATAGSFQAVAVEGFLSSGEFDDPTDRRASGRNVILQGIHSLSEVSKLTWTVPPDKDTVGLRLLRAETGRSTVMDELEIPLRGQGSAGLVPPSDQKPLTSLIGLRYVVSTSGWSPRMVDLRTASTSGIPVEPGQPLELLDLWAWVPPGAVGDRVQVEVYAHGDKIGRTPGKDLKAGAMQLGDVEISSFQHGEYAGAWEVQENWTDLAIILVSYARGEPVGLNRTTIRLDPKGNAWLLDPPNLSFASIVYSINQGHPLVLDLRDVEKVGLPAQPGDTLTIEEIRYRSNASSDDRQVNVEGFLNSAGNDWDKHIYTTPATIQAGIHRLPGVSSLSWVIPDHEDSLILSLWRIGEGPNVVMDGLSLPFGAQDSPGLVPASEAVIWPVAQELLLDFEQGEELKNWSGNVSRSTQYVFTGDYSLQATLTITEASPVLRLATWEEEFAADVLLIRYYLPSTPEVEIDYIEFCVPEWWDNCQGMDDTRDQWHMAIFDLQYESENVAKLPGLALLGHISAPDVTQPISYSVYLDTIQSLKFDDTKR